MKLYQHPLAPPWNQSCLVLTGPTASGKSALALQVAAALNAEIIAMDSMTLYRGMDIGTAKPTASERSQVPHHLIDVLEPWESASVAWWRDQALAIRAEIHGRGRNVLFVGGTPLYLKALLFGLFDGPPADQAVRDRLNAEANTNGLPSLHTRLAECDPAAAARIHPHDQRRIVRALEVWELTGTPISVWQTQWHGTIERAFRVVCIDVPREQLYERINRRVDAMFAAGLEQEVRNLSDLPKPMSREARQALGYKEVLEHLAGQCDLPATIERVKTRSRQYAKRQLTWFRSLPDLQSSGNELTSVLAAFRIV